MLVALDGEGLEASLVEMAGAGGMIVGVPAHGVGVGEPADEGGQLAVGPRPEHHVPVIGHEAVGQQADRTALAGLGQHAFEGREVLGLLEQRQPGHRPIEDVINQTAGSNTGLSWHDREGSIVDDGSQGKESRPLIRPRVEHVDEIFSFIPGGGGSQGFRVVVASPQRAIAVMTSMQTDGHGWRPLAVPPAPDLALLTINYLLGPPPAPARINVAYNTAVETAISASRITLQTNLALATGDYLWVPVWFQDRSSATVPPPVAAEAYSADLVNGLYVTPGIFKPPQPWGPHDGMHLRFPLDMNWEFINAGLPVPFYVNDWHWYHEAAGEVHCGTNTIRHIPTSHWWK